MSLLSIENCTKRFSGLTALNNVSLEICDNDIFGLIGPNGAGKTTLFNVITGTYIPNEGKIKFRGKDITRLPPELVCRKGISRTFQVPKPFVELTVLQNVMVGTTLRNSTKQGRKKALEIIESVGLAEKRDFFAGDLTVPELRKLELAKALATDPKVIFLDEVMAGLRPGEIKEALAMLKAINTQGITLIVIEHILEAVMTICNRILVLNYGEKIAEGSPEQIANDPAVITAYLGDEYVYTKG